MEFSACVLRGSSVEINPDEVKYWKSINDGYGEEFQKILAAHNSTYKDMLVHFVPGSGIAGAGRDEDYI